MKIVGTHGFLDPEYTLYGQLTNKSDAYNVTVVLLDIMSDKITLNTFMNSTFHYLFIDWEFELLKEG